MADKFSKFAAYIAFFSVIFWIVGSVVMWTESWIDWPSVVNALPFVIIGLIIASMIVGSMERRNKKNKDEE